MAKPEKQKLNRYGRLLEIDQRRLDTVCERLRAANLAVEQATRKIEGAREERKTVIRDADESPNIDNRMPTGVWLDWSARHLAALKADQARLEIARNGILDEYHYWNKRVKGWETLIEKLGLVVAKIESRREQELADEFATRVSNQTAQDQTLQTLLISMSKGQI